MTKTPSPYTRNLTPEQNRRRFQKQYAAWSKDMDAFFAAIKVLVEIGETDAAYELRVLHDTRLRINN